MTSLGEDGREEELREASGVVLRALVGAGLGVLAARAHGVRRVEDVELLGEREGGEEVDDARFDEPVVEAEGEGVADDLVVFEPGDVVLEDGLEEALWKREAFGVAIANVGLFPGASGRVAVSESVRGAVEVVVGSRGRGRSPEGEDVDGPPGVVSRAKRVRADDAVERGRRVRAWVTPRASLTRGRFAVTSTFELV